MKSKNSRTKSRPRSGLAPNILASALVCRKADGCLNLGRAHWCYCHSHKVKWCAGFNMGSSGKNRKPRKNGRGTGIFLRAYIEVLAAN